MADSEVLVDSNSDVPHNTSLPLLASPGERSLVVCKSGYGRYHSKVQLFTHSWLPEDPSAVKAIVYLIHGLHGHCVVFHEMAALFVQYGLAVYSHDNYGHGRSAGVKVLPPDFNFYWRDAVDRIREVSSLHPGVPVFAFGHSLGGLIVVDVMLELQKEAKPLSGAVLMSPALGKNLNMSKLSVLEFLAAPVSKVLPSFPVPTNLKVSNFTSVRKKQLENLEDPLVYHGQPKLKHVVMITEAMDKIPAKTQQLSTPYLLVSGDRDVITPLGPMRTFHQTAPDKLDKSFRVYAGMRHGLYQEKRDVRERLFQDIIQWVLERQKTSSPTADNSNSCLQQIGTVIEHNNYDSNTTVTENNSYATSIAAAAVVHEE